MFLRMTVLRDYRRRERVGKYEEAGIFEMVVSESIPLARSTLSS